MTVRAILRWTAVVAVMALIEWDPWLRYRDLDIHEGVHLAWVQHLAAGWKPGRDLCLSYGPLYSWSLTGFMLLTSWSVVGLRWYFWAAQTLGAVLAWKVLRSVCTMSAFATAGLVLYLVFTPAFLHWYGFTNGLRAMLALAAMLAGIQALVPPDASRRSAAARGGMLALAAWYSPEAGFAAIAGCLVTAIVVGMDHAGRRAGMLLTVGWAAGGGCAVSAVVLGAGCSGTLTERAGVLTEASWKFLHGYFTLPYLGGPLGIILPVILVGSTAAWLAGRIGGSTIGPGEGRHLALLVFGWSACRGILGRSDLPHVREATPAIVFLLAMHGEAGWNAVRRLAPRSLQAAWGVSLAAAAAGVIGLTLARTGAAMQGGAGYAGRPNILRSKSPMAFRIADNMRQAGLRTYVDLPRIGGLWLTPVQADQVVRITGEILHRTRPGEPLFATSNTEVYYFLADRVAANRFPDALSGIMPDDQAGMAASLSRCRVAVVDAILLDNQPWDWWLPLVGKVVHRDFSPVDRIGSVTLVARSPR